MVSLMLQVRFVPYRPELCRVTLEIVGMKGDSLLTKFWVHLKMESLVFFKLINNVSSNEKVSQSRSKEEKHCGFELPLSNCCVKHIHVIGRSFEGKRSMFGNLGGLQISSLVPDEEPYSVVVIVGGISKNVFEQRTSTGSGPFASLGSCFAHVCL